MENDSSVMEFYLMGLTEQAELQWPLFFLFLVNFIATVVGNLSLMILICLNSNLHTPMYFFLFNLSCIDFCYSFVCTPKTLMSFVSEKNIISFNGCMTQLFFFCLFVNSEGFILTAMAYDRYVAICQPLLYAILMSPRVCSLLMLASHFMGIMSAMIQTVSIVTLSFCDSHINHYMCETFPLFELSCGSTHTNELISSVSVAVVIIVTGFIILMSYALILFNIISLSSAKGLSKAMSTCSSHIITVALFYGFGLLTHVKPSSSKSMIQGKYFSVFYTFVLPLLNPLIYSLRNKDVKTALKRSLQRLGN